MRRITIPTLALSAAVGLVALPASGDVIINYSSSSQFTYDVTYMPDFDQRRDDLPGNGSAYCVPTAVLDATAFIARHGYPGVFPGSESYWYWVSQSSYDVVDDHLAVLGVIMGTTSSGTTTGGALGGLTGAGVSLGTGFVVYSQNGQYRHWQDMADFAVGGAIVIPRIGWYPNLSITARTGGHRVALARMARSGSSREMGFRDPASDEGNVSGRLIMQSPFVTDMTAVVDKTVQIINVNRTFNQLVDYSSDSTLGLLDGFISIYPMSGLTTSPDAINFQFFRPQSFGWDSLAGFTDFPFEFQGPIVGFDFASNSPDAFVVTSDALYQMSPISGEAEVLVELAEATAIAFARTPRVYVLEDHQLVTCYDVSEDVPVEEGTVFIPNTFNQAMVYDDMTDQIIALSVDPQQLSLLPKDLNEDPVPVPLPDIFIGGDAFMAIAPDGRLWVSSRNTPRHYLIRLVPDGAPIVEEHTNLVSEGGPMCVTDDNKLMLTEGGVVKVFKQDGAGGWVIDEGHPFEGWEVGDRFCITRSRSDYDPDVHDGPEYDDVLPDVTPPTEPDCVGDVTADNSVDVLDLLAVLSAWGTDDVDADQAPPGGDGVVNVADLLAILANWGPCP